LDIGLISFGFWHGGVHEDIWLRGMSMDIQKHLKATDLSFRELLFKFFSQQFNLISSVIPAFFIIIRKEVAVHIFTLQI
jgi:hypothetical protein